MAQKERGLAEIYSTIAPKAIAQTLIQSTTPRSFIKEGDVMMTGDTKKPEKPFHLFLLSDVLLICKKKKGKEGRDNYARYVVRMNNTSIKLVAVVAGAPNQFILMLKQITFSFRANSSSDRDEWLDAFKKVLSKQRNQALPERKRGISKGTPKINIFSGKKGKPERDQKTNQPSTPVSQSPSPSLPQIEPEKKTRR